ncbi:Predicted Fe-S protein [Burkholderia cenocepacia]|uniref:DUF1289 domain-containing protein n=1 Tax=Burkholderia cenocepacia TaxID=95486 RepID=UPI00192C49B9|nr:DUF1289 domain-containing protein [Burkholderia cenocepacia]CAD9221462.1 Predicted Fe-S protein [Burkholderia cenocepacia]
MSDVTMPVATVASPCIDVCRIDPRTDWCAGCLRTRGEIKGWRESDDDARHALLARLDARRRLIAGSET